MSLPFYVLLFQLQRLNHGIIGDWARGGGGGRAAIASSAAENNCRCEFRQPRHNCNWLVSSRSPERATPRRIIHKPSKLTGHLRTDGTGRPSQFE
ncbi:hypothetical protein niasHT_009271 [Heterodera trifolii]|uniref:Secreted protein n=1 Tax=Heterodera trifolii TaxID=157864 RepID=A0ABD2MB16_9BILA